MKNANEKVSNVLNSKLLITKETVYTEMCKVLGIKDEHIDCDSMVWHEIEEFIADKLFEMRDEEIDYIERTELENEN